MKSVRFIQLLATEAFQWYEDKNIQLHQQQQVWQKKNYLSVVQEY